MQDETHVDMEVEQPAPVTAVAMGCCGANLIITRLESDSNFEKVATTMNIYIYENDIPPVPI
jgi:hypothetical protein